MCKWCDQGYDVPLADWELDLLEGVDKVAVAEVEKGSKVRVTFEGKFSHKSATTGKPVVFVDNPGGSFPSEFSVPKDAKLEVLETPVPKEPPAGSVVEFPDGAVFMRTVLDFVETSWGHVNRKATSNNFWYQWKEIVKAHGPKFVHWSKPAVDLDNVRPLTDVQETVEGGCVGSLKVRKVSGDVQFELSKDDWGGDPRVCMRAPQARALAKRILKTVGVN